jgi:uncharacterized radical SAM superfamily protein
MHDLSQNFGNASNAAVAAGCKASALETSCRRLAAARELSRRHLGRRITFYLPGMFRLDGHTGRYPAVSITGDRCALQCDHCQGKILAGMPPAADPATLVATCRRMADQGHIGVLISGGCDPDGTVPWKAFLPAIETIKSTTDLLISVHCGLVDFETARDLKQAGVDQALVDVIGDDETYQAIYHVPFGVERIDAAMEALSLAQLPIVPHIVCGIAYGQIRGEYAAVDMIARYAIAQLVVVALMRIPGTPAVRSKPPNAEQVADIIAAARFQMPEVPISLGCARQRGNRRLEELAIDAGVNKLALPSERAVARAKYYGLEINYQPTCCSVTGSHLTAGWGDNGTVLSVKF